MQATETKVRPIGVLVTEYGGPTLVCRDAGIRVSTLWRIVTGKSSPLYATRQRLADTFNVCVEEIVYPADEEQS